MRPRALLVAAVALLALPAAAAAPSEPLLALERQRDTERLRLVELDPGTLAPVGAPLELRDEGYFAWARSPDGELLALGPWDVPRVTIVARDPLRVVREVALPAGLYAKELVWVAPDRLLALVGSCCTGANTITVIDPQRGITVARHAVPGPVRGVAALPDGLVLVLSSGSLGPARLAVVAAGGGIRTVALPRTRAGERGTESSISAFRVPGLAVDPDRRVAYVVGADEPVAEVDLRTLRVRYHALAPARSPQLREKSIEGPERRATWLGDGVIAVTGSNARRLAGGGTRFDPAGVHLVDTRTWERRTLAPGVQLFAASGSTLVVPLATRLAVFAADGSERFAVAGKFGWVQAVGGRAYAWREQGGMLVVDLATGATAPGAVADPPTLLGP